MTLSELLIATTNQKKGREMMQILSAALPGIKLVTLADFSNWVEVEETGETFEENARLKALAALKQTGLASLADDGGLVVDALGGAPGVHSHRFLGAETSFDVKMDYILKELHGLDVKQRTCRFQCAVALAYRDGSLFECLGSCEGVIASEKRGQGGFGYDPVFWLPDLQCCMAELSPEEKHRISHRGKALACIIEKLRD